MSVKNELKEIYNKYAKIRDTSRKQDWKIETRKKFLEILKESKAESLLEIGAGTGQDSLFFIKNGYQVTAIDLSEEHVKYCLKKGINAKIMDMYDMDYADNCFDGIYTINTLLHVPKNELQIVLKEMQRILKQDGILFIGIYGGYEFEGKNEKDNLPEKRFFSFYTFENYQRILQKYFNIAYAKKIDLEKNFEFHYFILKQFR